MLIKKIYIMKGTDGVKSVLKVNLLEKSFTEIELTTHFAYGDNYVFVLKSGAFVHIEKFDGKKIKRKLSPFNIDDLTAGVCYNGNILAWTAQTPSIPYCLKELAEKYSVIKAEQTQKIEPKEINSEEGTDSFEEPTEITIDEKIETKKDDIADDFGIVFLDEQNAPPDEENNVIREIEQKYNYLPHNQTLEELFPQSKWIADSDDNSFVGLLYNSDGITHICYAKLGKENEPFDETASYYDGYWIVFEEVSKN